MTRVIGTLTLVLFACAPACAPDDARPAVEAGIAASAPFGLDPALLPIGTDVSDMLIVSSEGTERIGASTGTVERSSLGSRAALRFILKQEFPLSTTTDTLLVDAATLLPLRFRHTMGDLESASLDYGPDGRITGRVQRMGVTTVVDTTVSMPVLDAAFVQPLVAALPLEVGYAARIPVFHFTAGARTVSVRVRGEGSLAYAGSDRPVWFVEYEGAPGRVILLAIDREDRRMLRAESAIDAARRYVQATR